MNVRLRSAVQQLSYCRFELKLISSGSWGRWFASWFGGSAGVILSYRLDRFFYIVFGEVWRGLRLLFFPFFSFLRLISYSHEIHYGANIGKGLKILHPSLGVVVSKYAIAGENLILTGGNCIGAGKRFARGELVLGNNVYMGANAVILGPAILGDNIKIGAGAVVVKDFPGNSVLVGVPARQVTD